MGRIVMIVFKIAFLCCICFRSTRYMPIKSILFDFGRKKNIEDILTEFRYTAPVFLSFRKQTFRSCFYLCINVVDNTAFEL